MLQITFSLRLPDITKAVLNCDRCQLYSIDFNMRMSTLKIIEPLLIEIWVSNSFYHNDFKCKHVCADSEIKTKFVITIVFMMTHARCSHKLLSWRKIIVYFKHINKNRHRINETVNVNKSSCNYFCEFCIASRCIFVNRVDEI